MLVLLYWSYVGLVSPEVARSGATSDGIGDHQGTAAKPDEKGNDHREGFGASSHWPWLELELGAKNHAVRSGCSKLSE